MEHLNRYIQAAKGTVKSDMVLKKPWIVDVFNQNIYKADIAICGGYIVGIGEYHGFCEIDCEGLYVTPGFIDAHVHIESSRVIPEVFGRLLIKKGVAACIADPHEIANVMGGTGIEYMLNSIKNSPMDIYLMMPSCVPAVEFEDNGAVLDAYALGKYMDEKEVLGLGEVMDVQAVVNMDEAMMDKLFLFKDCIIDGHCPGITGEWLNAYALSGIKTDHECTTAQQAIEKVRRGMYVMLREGSATRNLENLLGAVDDWNYHSFLFCTDDKEINDLENEGSIDHNIRLAVKYGMDPVRAITIATLNAAQCYNLKNTGAIAPGYKADMVLLKDLENVAVDRVIKDGTIYSESPYSPSKISVNSSMNIDHVDAQMLKVPAYKGNVNVIKVLKNSIETKLVHREAVIKDGFIEGIASQDFVKVGVFERHKRTGKYAIGFVEGLGLKGCSIAQTIAHDSHNIIAVGDSDTDMAAAINRVIDIKGGIVAVSNGRIAAEIGLPVAGLMTNEDYRDVIDKLNCLNMAIKGYSSHENSNIISTLSFMSLPVIPEVKITARGLYHFNEGRFISLYCR